MMMTYVGDGSDLRVTLVDNFFALCGINCKECSTVESTLTLIEAKDACDFE